MAQFWVGYIAGIVTAVVVVWAFIAWACREAKKMSTTEFKNGVENWFDGIGLPLEEAPIDAWSEYRKENEDE